MDLSTFNCLEKGNKVWHKSGGFLTLRFVKSNKLIRGKRVVTLERGDLNPKTVTETNRDNLQFNLL